MVNKSIVIKKVVARILFAFLLTNILFGGMPGITKAVKAAEETPVFKFDFGGGAVKEGYTQVKSTTSYSEELKYGFTDVSKVTSNNTGDADALKGDYLISNGTTFNVDLQPGDYKVNVIFGDTAAATTVDVGVERKFGKDYNGKDTYLLNMMKLTNAKASAGEFLEKSFTISLVDNQLNLDFVGEAAKINGLEIYKLPPRTAGNIPTVYIASDSTVQTYDPYYKPQAGWGQMLERYFTDNVKIDNRAIGGRSSRSFVSEGRLDAILSEIKHGDYLFVQWGHNDATYSRPERYVSEEDFPTYIKMYIDGARQRGANPVLITPVSRRSYNSEKGEFNISFPGYRQKMMDMAKSEKVSLIDLGLKSKEFLDTLGSEGSKSIFLHVPAGVYGAFPSGSTDDTHFQEFGAIQMARLVSEGVKEANLSIAQYLKDIQPPASVPDAPQGLVSGKIGSTTIAMSWNAVEGVDIYYIYRQKDGETEFKKAGTSTITQFTDTNAAQKTTYTYKVVAVNAKGESLPSNTITVTTKAPGYRFDFGMPRGPVEPGFTEVPNNLEYTPERGYGLSPATNNGRDRGASDTYNNMQRDFILGKTEFKLDVPNGDYSVKITVGDPIGTAQNALSAEGKSLGTVKGKMAEKITDVRVLDGQLNIGSDGWLNGIEVTTILLSPTGLRSYEKILGETPSVVLAWNQVENAANFNIYRKSDTDDDFIKINTVAASSDNKYFEQSVNLGSNYQYKVTAVTSDGYESGESNIIDVEMIDPNVPKPAAPTGIKVSESSKNSVALSWDAVQGAVLYNVYRAKAENGTYVKVGSSKETKYTDTTVITNINYYYKVQAISAGGPSDLSAAIKTEISTSLKRRMEKIEDRALIAMKTENGVYLGWRSLINDPKDMAFNVYRDNKKINSAPVSKNTNYLDPAGNIDSTYFVRPVVNGVEQTQSKTINVLANNYFDIKIDKPKNGTTPLGATYEYSANDASVGDLDGDGDYEIVLKWQPSFAKDNSQAGYTGETILDAYEIDGSRLWRINLGKNIRSGAHYTQFMVYDFDGDGKAEVACKTADGTVDGVGTVIGDPTADYRNPSGYILTGPEYLTIFNGQTGAAIDTIDYKPGRGRVDDWGDSYGNRVDRFLAAVAYLNGETPSLVMARGYYTRAVLVAYDFVDGKLQERWTTDSNDPKNAALAGQGNHNIAVADVDGDQMDEIIYGGAAVDNDGTLLYSTGLGHGDAQHLSDLDPTRPGLEYFQVHEHYPSKAGMEMRDADSGELIWGVPSNIDVGRGVAADIDPRYEGAEAWAIDGEWNSTTGGLYTAKGDKLGNDIPSSNFSIYWDGDLLRELLDHKWDGVKGVGKIDKWDYENNKLVNLLTATDTNSNNGTKGNPSLQADLFGDWREEVIWRTTDNSALRVYSTTILTDYKFTTLMQDPVYRLSIAWQNVGYNQPPQVGFYLGDNSTPVNLKAADVASRSVTLDWSDVLAGAEGYNIYRSNTIDGEFVKVGTSTESTFRDTTVKPQKEYFYKVTSVVEGKESYDSIKVKATTPFGIDSVKPLKAIELIEDSAAIDLPTKVAAVGSDGKDVMADVTWDTSTMDVTTPGNYTVKGTISGFDGKIELAVIVKANYITGFKAMDAVNTIETVNPALPEKVSLVYANKTEREVNVTWDKKGLDINKAGTYTIIGTVQEYAEKVSLTVIVKQNYIVSIKPVEEVKVAEGKAAVLPDKVTAVYANDTEAKVPVTWEAVDTSRHGNFTVEGTVQGYDSKVTVTVVVYDEPMFKLDMGGDGGKRGYGRVEPGYTEVKSDKVYEGGSYGFDKALTCINRANSSENAVFEDYASTWNDFAEFKVDLPNGTYKIKIYSGDLNGSTNTTFTIEDKTYSKISSKNTVNVVEYVATVIDGVLNIKFGQGSGMGALNGLEITKVPVDDITAEIIKTVKGADIKLPTTVKATYHDGSVKDLNVTWRNVNTIDTDVTGVYLIEGTVAETDIKANAYVFVADILQPAPLEFIVGMPVSLPQTVIAIYGDNRIELPVTWSGLDVLSQLGNHTIQGKVADYDTTVAVQVKIKADYIASIRKVQTVEALEGLNPKLPTTVTAVYATGKEKSINVTWDTSKLNKNVPGTYNLKGTVKGFAGQVTLTVVIKEASITEVKPSEAITVEQGSVAKLPDTVTAVYNNGENRQIAVVWDEVDTSIIGDVKVKGTVKGFDSGTSINVSVVKATSIDTSEVGQLEAVVKDASNKDIYVDINKEAPIVKGSILSSIKGQDRSITFVNKADDGTVLASWTFNGKLINKNVESIDLTIKFTSPIQKEIKKISEDGMIISFSHHGDLPGKTTIKVKVDSTWLQGKNKDKLNLYYYNPEAKKLEAIAKDLKVDSEGYVQFELEHCSDYVLSDKALEKTGSKDETPNAQTPGTENKGDKDPGNTESKEENSNTETQENVMPKTGSVVDFDVLFILGITSLAIGAVIILKKRKAITK